MKYAGRNLITVPRHILTDISDACGDDTWSLNGEHCYKLMTDEKKFNKAEENCENEEAVLTPIESDDQKQFLLEML